MACNPSPDSNPLSSGTVGPPPAPWSKTLHGLAEASRHPWPRSGHGRQRVTCSAKGCYQRFFCKKITCFPKVPWGVLGGSWGQFGSLGGQFGSKSLSIRIHGVFPRRPDRGSHPSRPAGAWEGPALAGPGWGKAGLKSIWGAGCGRSCHRVVELVETKPSE